MNMGLYIDVLTKALPSQRFGFKNNLYHLGWLNAWKPEKYGKPVSFHAADLGRSDRNFRDGEEVAFIEFAANALHDADPSTDKKYFPKLCKWLAEGMTYDELSEIATHLREYERLAANDKDISSDPYLLYRMIKIPGMKRRALPSNPIDAAFHARDIKNFIETYKDRQARSKTFDPEGNPKDVDDTNIVHACADFYLYRTDDYDKPLVLELPNGAQYSLNLDMLLNDGFPECRDENRALCMFERMMRDIPGLADALVPIYKELQKTSSRNLILNFAHLQRSAGVHANIEEGAIAEAFESGYKTKLENYAAYKAQDQEFESEGRSSRARKLEDGENPYARMFYDVYDDIAALAHFPGERAQVDKDLIFEILRTSVEVGAVGSARRALHVINSVKSWRDHVTPDDIRPILQGLSGQKTDPIEAANFDISELFEDQANPAPARSSLSLMEGTPKYLAEAMAFLSTTPHWRNGSEAEYLPAALDHILRTKDWKNLKKILLCATKPDDPVSEAWRDAIPMHTRKRIADMTQDNFAKSHYIHLLMKRLHDVESGLTRMFRLTDMPDSPEALAFHDQRTGRIRSSRESRRPADASVDTDILAM